MDASIKKDIRNIHVISFSFVIILGTLIHYFYEWSGNNPVVALFCAVNESTWEHFKLGFWSFIIFSIIDYRLIRKKSNNYFIAKALGIVSMQVFIAVFFYLYLAIFKNHNFFFDIGLYIAGALLCHIISYLLMIRNQLKPRFKFIGISILIIFALCLMIFTYLPPRNLLFKDPIYDQYGIIKHQSEHE